MQPTSCIATAMQVYGSNATTYREPPTPTQMENGVIPLDSLPADWWNWLWYSLTTAEATIVTNLSSVFNEIISVLTAAGKTPSGTDSTQLLESIRALCAVVATTTKAGSVLSSTTAGELSVDGTTGKATINCLGNPASLDTTNKEVVSAINEVLAITGDIAGKAPTYHASSDTTYGIGGGEGYINNCCTPSCFCKIYGHVALTPIQVDCGNWISGAYSVPDGIALSARAACSHFRRCAYGATTDACINAYDNPYGHIAVRTGCGLALNNGILSMGNATISTTTYPGACCTGTVTSIQFNSGATCCCKITGSGTVCLGCNAWNSTAFTTCTGTVTGVKFNGTTYSGTGVVDIGSITGFPGYGTATCVAGTAAAGSCTCVSRADHVHALPWCNCRNIAIGCTASTGACCDSIAIGCCARTFSAGSIAMGKSTYADGSSSVAIGYAACGLCDCVVAIGRGAMNSDAGGVTIGAGAHYCKQIVGSAWIASNWMGDILLLKWYGVIQNCVLAKHLYTTLCHRFGGTTPKFYMGGSLSYCTTTSLDAGGIGFVTCPLCCCTNSSFIKMFIRTGTTWSQSFSCTTTTNTCYMDVSTGYGSALLHVYCA